MLYFHANGYHASKLPSKGAPIPSAQAITNFFGPSSSKSSNQGLDDETELAADFNSNIRHTEQQDNVCIVVDEDFTDSDNLSDNDKDGWYERGVIGNNDKSSENIDESAENIDESAENIDESSETDINDNRNIVSICYFYCPNSG